MPGHLEACRAPEVFVGQGWRYRHCDYYGIDVWGQGILVTVSSGKSSPSRAFVFSPIHEIFLNITVWSSDVSVSSPLLRGLGRLARRGPSHPGHFSLYFMMPLKNQNLAGIQRGLGREGPPVGESQDPLGGSAAWATVEGNLLQS